jgi:GTPase
VLSQNEENYRAGFVGLIGQPNAGKSTLMNFFVQEKVSIVSAKPQTTRRRILGIHSENQGQIVFIDAPGVIQADRGLNGFLAQEAMDVCKDSDLLIAVLSLDAEKPEEIDKTLELVKNSGKKCIVAITKCDIQEKSHRLSIIEDKVKTAGFESFKVQGLNQKQNLNELRSSILAQILNLLPKAPAPFYSIDLFTPETEKGLALEIIREKCFELLHQEVPFQLATRMIKFDEMAKPVPRISAEIIVEKETHKGIVIGKGASVIKEIGTLARKDIEKMLDQKVFLEIFVRVSPGWSENKGIMKELGYESKGKK